jgi:hypothetical protein
MIFRDFDCDFCWNGLRHFGIFSWDILEMQLQGLFLNHPSLLKSSVGPS